MAETSRAFTVYKHACLFLCACMLFVRMHVGNCANMHVHAWGPTLNPYFTVFRVGVNRGGLAGMDA